MDVVEIVMAFEDEFGITWCAFIGVLFTLSFPTEHAAVEIDDEQAEKMFTANDAVELLKTKLDIH